MEQKLVHALYKKYSNKLPILEIGAGWWPLFDFEHVCFDKAYTINGQKTCANHFGDFHDMSDFKDNTFAFICALNVIEHAKHPEIALKEWCRILQEDGVLLLDWPAVGFAKSTPEELKKFEQFENALNKGDIDLYLKLGGNMSWVSKDINGKYFLDAHYSILSLEEMKQILPKEFVILEEDPPYGFLILKKQKTKYITDDNSLISVIVPTYNQAKYIDETINSILNQTYQNFEIIIVNDGSTDNTLEVLEKYKDNKKIKIVTQENKKLPSALNTGLKHVSGNYITWISSDSYYHPKAFEVMLKTLKENSQVGLVSTHFKIFGNREVVIQNEIGIYRLEEMKIGNYVGCCFLFRKECADKIGLYNETLECVEDWDYWIRISQYWPLFKIYGVYAYWRDHESNMTNRLGKNLGVENSLILAKQVEKLKRSY